MKEAKILGLSEIILIKNDAFLTQKKPYFENKLLIPVVGEAVLKVISELRRLQTQKNYESILNHMNAVQFVDEVDQTQQRIYLWQSNTLRKIQDLNDADLTIIDQIVKNEKQRRGLKL